LLALRLPFLPPPPVPVFRTGPEFEPDFWVWVRGVDVVWVDVGWFDWVDVPLGALPGELEALDVELGVELEVLGGRVVLVGGDGVDVPDPLGEGTVGLGTLGVETVGVGTLGVETVGVETVGVGTVGVDTSGVVTVSADADGRATMPITTSVAIAPTTSFRLRNTGHDLLKQVCSSNSAAPRPQASHVESPAPLRSRGGSRSRAPRPRASPPTASHLDARRTSA
jgi:SP family facilitated glucose transporter-like MFS transporter 11